MGSNSIGGGRVSRALLGAVCWFGLCGQTSAPANSPLDLMTEFKAVCLDWQADRDAGEEIALERGYRPAPELIPDDLFQRGGLEVWTKTENGVEARVVLQTGGGLRFYDGNVSHQRCFVSVDPGDLRAARADIRRYLGFRHFSQQDTSVFAWIMTPEGRQPVPRAAFDRALRSLINSRGMQMITVTRHRDQVIMGYSVPAVGP